MGAKVMIVDDDKEFLTELEEMLNYSGYDTIAVNNSYTVLNAAIAEKPDCILLDLKMDGKDGFQVTEELKRSPGTGNIPIIAMTAYFTREEHAMLISMCGIEACIIKPFNPLDVICRIEASLMKTKT